MAQLTADEVTTKKHRRIFIQFGGAAPNNPPKYGGKDTQYMSLNGVSAPIAGSVDAIRVHDPERIGSYKLIGRSISAPDNDEAELVLHEKHGALPFHFYRTTPAFNVYIPVGVCKNLSDFLRGWSDWVEIASGAIINERDLGDRGGVSGDDDDATEVTLSLTLADYYAVGQLGFGETGATDVANEVMDVTFALGDACADDDGTKRIYGITKGDGSTTPGVVVYSLDGGLTTATAAVTGMLATETPAAIAVVGNYLVVVSPTGQSATISALYVASLSDTGVPGAFQKISTGFVASKLARDIYVAGPSEVYLVGDGGYIYTARDILSGVTVLNAAAATTSNLNRIHAKGATIVAAGAAGAVVISQNGGRTFATALGSAGSSAQQAVAVKSAQEFWVGAADGTMRYTLNGGVTWQAKVIPNATGVLDIVFVTPEVGYVAYTTGSAPTTARLWATWNGGADWDGGAPRILSLPTFTRATRIAAPQSSDSTTNVNTVALAGLGGGGTDGILLVGAAARQ